MQQIKYKAFSKNLGMSDAIDFRDLISENTDFPEFEIYLQYLGFKDFNNREVYEGDVLRLVITDELMDASVNAFHNSNLGKYIAELRKKENVTGFLLHMDCVDAKCRSMYYEGFIEIDGFIERCREESTILQTACRAQDCDFPIYLCEKGACIIGNTVENETILLDIAKVKNL